MLTCGVWLVVVVGIQPITGSTAVADFGHIY